MRHLTAVKGVVVEEKGILGEEHSNVDSERQHIMSVMFKSTGHSLEMSMR